MRQLFVSYARENKHDVDELVRHLNALGYQTWVDSSLRGGQRWWDEILQRIADSDVFVAIISGYTLNSVACKRELEWALALEKPVLPVAVERLPDALPRSLMMRQIVDYSQPDQEAAFALAGALANLPATVPSPVPLPDPPHAPLSYLSDLVEHAASPEPLTHEQQRQVLIQLEPALRSADAEERRGGRYVLKMFSRRDDLYADVDRALARLGITQTTDEPAAVWTPTLDDEVAPEASSPEGGPGHKHELAPHPQGEPLSRGSTSAAEDAGPGHQPTQFQGRSRVIAMLVVAGVFAVVGAVVLAVFLSGGRSGNDQGGRRPGPSSTYRVTAPVPVTASPTDLAVDSATQVLYVATHDGKVSVIDPSTNRVTDTVTVGVGPSAATVDPSNHEVFVANGNTVSVIDGSTRKVIATASLHRSGAYVDYLYAKVAIDSETHTIYVANGDDQTVSVIDGTTRAVVATIQVGRGAFGLAVDPETHTLYVANGTADSVSVIEGSTRKVVATLDVGGVPLGLAVDRETRAVYVTHMSDDSVSVIDGSTRKIIATVQVGNSPRAVAVDPKSLSVYVPNSGDDTVSVIDGSTHTVVTTVPVGKGPEAVTVNSENGAVYVANFPDASVSILRGT